MPILTHIGKLMVRSIIQFYKVIFNFDVFIDRSMQVEIVGDQEEAIQWKELQQTLEIIVDEEEDQSEVDTENQEIEEVVETKKRRHRKSVQVDPMEEKKKKLLEVHPLSVDATINVKDGPSIKIKLTYYVNLEIITVSSSVNIPNSITGKFN